MDTDSDDEPMFPFPQDDNVVSAFSYPDPLLASPLIKAVLSGSVKTVKRMIQTGKHVNNPDNCGCTPLHWAVIEDKLKIVDLLLQQSEINLDCKTHRGNTPLLLSIALNKSDSLIERLLVAGCDVNAANNMNETPLHRAVKSSSTSIAYELLRRGAEVNAVDGNGYSPLHNAVESNQLEAVCMLLYHCADVNIRCSQNLTPFMHAVNDNKLNIAKVLFDYYADFSCITSDGYTSLLLAANSLSDIAIDIVKAGADVNCVTPSGDSVVSFSLHYMNAQLFKIVWPKFNHRSLLGGSQPFLFKFMNSCCYPLSEWVECMYEIMNSPLIYGFVEECSKYIIRNQTPTFFETLVGTMYKQKVALNDRLTIIQTYLSFGAPVYVRDVSLVHDLYGFNEELEIFVQLCDHRTFDRRDSRGFPLSTFILAQEKSYSVEYIIELFKHQFIFYMPMAAFKYCGGNSMNAFDFFSLPYRHKQELISCSIYSSTRNAMLEKLESVPEMPSLVELSRNQFRKYVKEIYLIKTPYHFHNIINNLNIPIVIRDIILFKKPLYN